MRWRKSAVAVGLLMLAIPGNSCGPFFTEVIFFNSEVPTDVAAFFDGHLGVVQRSYTPRYLALTYRMLSGPALTAQEKSSLLAGVKARQNADYGSIPNSEQVSEALDAWNKERSAIAPSVPEFSTVSVTSRPVPGQDWEQYSNCLADSYVNATLTLANLAKDHAAEKDALAEWIKGQDAVFSNCGDNAAMPSPVTQPLWLAQDRAYQIAAAHFYRSEFGPAQDEFQQIAGDRNSPFRTLAAFMVGRCLLRQATLSLPDKNDDALMGKAAAQFRQVIQAGGPYAGPAQELLNFVELRTNPSVAAARLGDLVSQPDARIEQHLVDLAYVSGNAHWLTNLEDARKSDLIDWALTMQRFPIGTHRPVPPDQLLNHAKDRWRATGNVAWLVAAFNFAHAPDAELAKAAESIPPTSPAWITLTYDRLNTIPATAVARVETENVLRDLVARHESQDTVHLFTILARQKAESVHEFARLAPMEPAGEDDGDDAPGPLPATGFVSGARPMPTMAGLPINVQGDKRLDDESARILNRHIPLKDLVSIVLQSSWPKQLRFELAMAVWTRAVLLNQPHLASSLTPALIAGEPGWKQWLGAYDAATTDDDRRVTGLIALLRFPSVRPYINAGAGREDGFVGYSSYRDNWWCATMDQPTNITPLPADPPPSFTTNAMEADAKQEQAELAKIGDAPEYFGKQAMAWVKDHPKDPRNAELLGFAFRAMRNGCNLENSTGLRREVFTTLHAHYPQSEWSKRYPNFITDDQ